MPTSEEFNHFVDRDGRPSLAELAVGAGFDNPLDPLGEQGEVIAMHTSLSPLAPATHGVSIGSGLEIGDRVKITRESEFSGEYAIIKSVSRVDTVTPTRSFAGVIPDDPRLKGRFSDCPISIPVQFLDA